MRRPIFATLGLALATLLASCALAETLLVVRKSADALDFVDPGSGLRLATVELGHAPHEVSVAPDGRRAAVSNYGTRERPGSTLSIVDLERPRELVRIDLMPHTRPHGVDWFAPDRIAVTTEGSQHLLVVDPDASRIVLAVPTAQEVSHMVAVAANATRAFVANIGSGSTTAIDLAAGRRLRDIPTGKGSEAIALSPDGRELWVGAREVDQVVIVDTDSLEIEATLAVPGIPIRIALAPDGHTAFVTCAGTGELVAIDTATRRARAREDRRSDGDRRRPATLRAPFRRQRIAGRPSGLPGWPQRVRGRHHGRCHCAFRRRDRCTAADDTGRWRTGWTRPDTRAAACRVPRLRSRPAP